MTELNLGDPKPAVLTEDQIAEGITRTINAFAVLPDEMSGTKHLASTYAVYLDETGYIQPPQPVVNLELLRVIGLLELRIAALEKALDDAKIARGTVKPL